MSSLRAVRLVHPFPSLVNAVVVLGLALLAGGSLARAALLAGSMLCIQFCIGVVNDISDEELDARTKQWKPIPAGLVSRRMAAGIAAATGGAALLSAFVAGPVPLTLAVLILGAGLAYDLYLKPTAWAWVAFAIAFTALPVFAWFGAAGTFPPRAELLLPLAALAAPALQLANGLADLEADRRAGIATLATRLGLVRGVVLMAVVLAILHTTAWVTLVGAPVAALVAVTAATLLSVSGLALSAARQPGTRQAGWAAQVVSLALLAVGWLAAAV